MKNQEKEMSRPQLEAADDRILIREYLSGDTESFSILYARYRVLLYNYLNQLLNFDRVLADDLFQQTWIRALDNLSKYHDRQQFSAWLLRIAHNLVMDSYRRDKKFRQLDGGSLDDEDNHFEPAGKGMEPWRELSNTELGNAIREALEKLSPDLREVFLLRQEELSFKEIADIQKTSVNTVLGRMQYALKNLRKYLAEWKS
jgi:RNA polymerase sigma-70 factor (ECF subfamily)